MSVERIAEFTRLDDDNDVLVQPPAPPPPAPAAAATAATAAAAVAVAAATAASVTTVMCLSEAAGASAGAARGCVELRDVWLRYRPHEPPVLRGLSLRLAAGTKLAVCGRSGCGKTSLLRALVRLLWLHLVCPYLLWSRQDLPTARTGAPMRPSLHFHAHQPAAPRTPACRLTHTSLQPQPAAPRASACTLLHARLRRVSTRSTLAR